MTTAHPELEGIGKYEYGWADVDVTDVEDALSYFEKTRESAKNGEVGIKSNIASFDACLPMGIAKGQLGILLAYPAIGRSWLALYFAFYYIIDHRTERLVCFGPTHSVLYHLVENHFHILETHIFGHRQVNLNRFVIFVY